MNERAFCPYCDELVTFEFNDDYYFTKEGEEASVCECSACGKEVSMSWGSSHNYYFNKKDKGAEQ